MGQWLEPGGAVEEEGADVAAALREALVAGGASEREEKQREPGEGAAEPCVGVVGRAVRERATSRTPLSGPRARCHLHVPAHSRPRYRPPAAEAHDMDLTRLPKVSATS